MARKGALKRHEENPYVGVQTYNNNNTVNRQIKDEKTGCSNLGIIDEIVQKDLGIFDSLDVSNLGIFDKITIFVPQNQRKWFLSANSMKIC